MALPPAEGIGLTKHPLSSSNYPTYFFASDEGTGVGSVGSGYLDFFCNYTKVAELTSTGFAITTADYFTIAGAIVDPYKTVMVPLVLATSAIDQWVFIAPRAMKLAGIKEVHTTKASDSGSIVVRKATGTQSITAGTALHATAIDLTAANDTTQTVTLTSSTAALTMAAGDRLSFDFSGTLTAFAGGAVELMFQAV